MEFLRSLYTLEVKEEEYALKLFRLASKLDVTQLKPVLEAIIIKKINGRNAMEALRIGNRHKSNRIIDAAFARIQASAPRTITSDSLKRKPDLVKKALELRGVIKKATEEIEDINGRDKSGLKIRRRFTYLN